MAEYYFNSDRIFDMLTEALVGKRRKTVEEIEMDDCAFLWDLGIRADDDLVRPTREDKKVLDTI